VMQDTISEAITFLAERKRPPDRPEHRHGLPPALGRPPPRL
jgi:hypothetical protein